MLDGTISPEWYTLEDMVHRVEYDLEYIRHASLLFDLEIIVKTIPALFRDDAY